MGRVIHTGKTPAKQRHVHRRSCAEAIRILAQRRGFDTEAQDIAAFVVLNLYGIHETIEQSAASWDERGYWKKAEALRQRWHWCLQAARELESCLLEEAWNDVPPLLVSLVPHFEDITVRKVTRNADWWCGALRALKRRAAN